MVAIEHHHYQTPRARWREFHRAERVRRHRHDGRGEFWQLVLLGLAAFWCALAYGIYVLT
jgi:hypothetical protein